MPTVFGWRVCSGIFKRIGLTISLIDCTTNTVNEANIEDKEEYLNIRDIANHVNINNKLSCKDNANKNKKQETT